MTRKVRTSRLKARHGIGDVRLTARDRAFFSDLAKVSLLDEASASAFHYAENKTGAGPRLDKLTALGLLRKEQIIDPSRGRVAVYAFANERVARSFGGRAAYTGRNRTTYHELLVSRSYFDLGRPADFRLATHFDKADLARFGARPPTPPHLRETHHGIAGEAAIPDAVYTDDQGRLVVVEADAGHYTTRQIRQKMDQWQGMRQVWVQPSQPHARVTPHQGIDVLAY